MGVGARVGRGEAVRIFRAEERHSRQGSYFGDLTSKVGSLKIPPISRKPTNPFLYDPLLYFYDAEPAFAKLTPAAE